jgi:hypothetical protein
MRRICLLFAIAACAVPGLAFAGSTAAGDGSLDVTGTGSTAGASGSLFLTGKGVAFGYVGAGAITVYGYRADGNSVPSVSGARMKLSSDASSVVYTGTNMRFLFPGGRYKISIDGTGINISAVGNGSVWALGTGTVTVDTGPLALGRAQVNATWGTSTTAGASSGRNNS